MRISVNGGHTPTSPGASGLLNEVYEDRIIKDRLIAELRARGHSVSDSTADDGMGYPQELNTQVARANSSGAELGVSIHLNAGGGTGPEVLYHYTGGAGADYAARISARLAECLGLPDRGAKSRNDLYWLNGTNMTAVLVEVCFVDSPADKAAYDAVSYEAIACAIADGIEGTVSDAPSAPPAAAPAPSGGIPDLRYCVRTGGEWLPEMVNHTDTGGSSDDFAGRYGAPIEYIAIGMHGWYQVRSQRQGWLPPVRGYDTADLEDGCAGDGSPITGIKCYYETQDAASTGWLVIEYQVHTVGGSWLPLMRDLEDTGGSADDFAGNGAPIDGFSAILRRN